MGLASMSDLSDMSLVTTHTQGAWVFQPRLTRAPGSSNHGKTMRRAWQPSQTHAPGQVPVPVPDNYARPRCLRLVRHAHLGLATMSHPRGGARQPSIDFGFFLFCFIRESPPSIWSLETLTGLSEILRQGTGCVKEKY
jgi:hypothetical protein